MPDLMSLTQHFPYVGLFILLILGGLGLPFPEDATLILCGFLLFHGTVKPVPAFLAVLIGLATFLKKRFGVSRKQKLLQRKEELTELQRKLQTQYLKEGSVDRKTFYDLSTIYDSELRRVEQELAEGERKKDSDKPSG